MRSKYRKESEMHPSIIIASYGYYLFGLYAASLFNPATYLTPPASSRRPRSAGKA